MNTDKETAHVLGELASLTERIGAQEATRRIVAKYPEVAASLKLGGWAEEMARREDAAGGFPGVTGAAVRPKAVLTHMRRFQLHRDYDETGVSGTGIVAEGIEFTNGMIAITWLSPHRSVTVYESIKTVEQLHGHGGKTRVVFVDGWCSSMDEELLSAKLTSLQSGPDGAALSISWETNERVGEVNLILTRKGKLVLPEGVSKEFVKRVLGKLVDEGSEARRSGTGNR